MSYIYMERLFLMFLDHTQWRSTVGRTPLDEWLARRRDLYLTFTTLTTDKYPCPRWDSNPRSQQASSRRPLACCLSVCLSICLSICLSVCLSELPVFNNTIFWLYFKWLATCGGGPGSSVGIATEYGLDGPGIESRWGRNFPHLSRPSLGPTQPPVQRVPSFSRR